MYRQRPAYPALIAAACVLVLGGFMIYGLKQRVDDGIGDESAVLLVGCITCGIVMTLLVSAFARYQFTHLWKKPDPAFVKKKNRKK